MADVFVLSRNNIVKGVFTTLDGAENARSILFPLYGNLAAHTVLSHEEELWTYHMEYHWLDHVDIRRLPLSGELP